MLQKNSLVLYKTQPAVIIETGEKYTIEYCTALPTVGGKSASFAQQKVREKDITPFPGNVSALKTDLPAMLAQAGRTPPDISASVKAQLSDVYELLASDPETAEAAVSFSDIAALTGTQQASDVWSLYLALKTEPFFADASVPGSGDFSFTLRTAAEMQAITEKQNTKNREQEIRAAFIARLKQRKLQLPDDAQLMQDVEALALGKTDKSRTLKEAGFSETPEKAHKLLLDTGIWTAERNPYPSRWGLSMQSAAEHLAHPPQEDRVTVSGVSYAIDNAWSTDPDDAIAFDGTHVWVHVADPASIVAPDSTIDTAARNRGTTLYIPEGAARMLAEESLEDYALGLAPESRALSFKILLDETGAVADCDILKTIVKVERLTYVQADGKKETPELAPLYAIAKRNEERRIKAGAVSISLPEVHIAAAGGDVSITPVMQTQASAVVREFMLLAGEAAARFAFKHAIPFPYVSQERPDIPKDLPEGLAGQYRLRRCMRSRSIGITPLQHAGLGLGMYSQVTSPLRRYGDLVAHQQLRAFIGKKDLLGKDELLERIAAGDAAASTAVKAERKSNLHWTLVYLSRNPEWTGQAVVVELKGKQAVCLIPELGQETVLNPSRPVQLNDTLTVRAGNISIPDLLVTFTAV
ncbi:ribonuclease catalytic domain-containing protein [Treponema brennaborense]|uniref:Ribonuclease II n=1 Tax=Treponema brennaborense (strain DSM 12168 / CIP 105900 / DD5/3) TaxID=906968 RepID=F4LM16_TREBD|nr:RNB domain-containing ribonuclease [Treponema brennaborense]AEE16695.1 ribonuclease II [Treponema brennaborense DSM 12168]